jgi:hypothetical protein
MEYPFPIEGIAGPTPDSTIGEDIGVVKLGVG